MQFTSDYETLYLSYEESRSKESRNVLSSFQRMKEENKERTCAWNIEPGSEKSTMMKGLILDKRNQERLIIFAPGFSIKVAGPSFTGEVMAIKDKKGYFHITLPENPGTGTGLEFPPIGEEMLMEALETIINGNPRFAA